jgi:type I restriction enzyme S subunit
MKKYDSYKDSGVEWIGEVPTHWHVDILNRIFKINTGFTPSTSNNEFYENGEHDWITIRDLDGKYVSESKTKLTDIAVKGKTIIPKGSLLYSFKLSVGQMAFTTKDIYTNEAIFSVFPSENLNLNYYYYLLDRILIHNSNENIYGAKILNQELIKASKLLVPSEEEQTTIANYLDHKTTQIEHLIAKKEQFIQLLEEERIALINQAVTKGLDPSVPMKDSGIDWLGEIPEHWEVKKLKYVCSLISNKAKTKPNFVLALENIESWTGEIVGDPYSNSMEGEVQSFQEGDILFNKLRPYLAKVCLAKQEGGAIGELLVLRPSEIIDCGFLYQRLRSEMIITIVDGSTYGTKMPRASWDKFISQLEIGVPTLDEQIKIENYIVSTETRIRKLASKTQQEIELLKEYKTALISEVVTGKVDVRNEKVN